MSDYKNKLEMWLLTKFQELDPHAQKTPGSGCGATRCGDIQNKFCFVEAKEKHTQENITLQFKKEYQHHLFKMPTHTDKIPIFCIENMYGNKFIILQAEDFFDLLKEAKT